MKRILLPLVLAMLVLLAGCKGGGKGPAPTPSPSPIVVFTPTPVPEAEEDWWNSVKENDLPIFGGESLVLDTGLKINCLGQLSDPDISLYSVLGSEGGAPGLTLRYGAQFQTTDNPSPWDVIRKCELFWRDFDGDGKEELLFTLKTDARSSLTVCTWNDGWTANTYDHYGKDLASALSFQKSGRTATVTYGNYSASYTMGPNDSSMGGLSDFDEYVFFHVDQTGKITAAFAVGVDVDGTARRFASLTADVDYDGGNYTLRHIALVSTGGV